MAHHSARMVQCGVAAALLCGCVAVAAPQITGSAPAMSAARTVSFKHDIKPIFQWHCAVCHVSSALGGVSLASYAGLRANNLVVGGPIIKPGHHTKSLLWQVVQPKGPWPGGFRMPIGGPPFLPAKQINSIAVWIDQGAKNN